MREWNEGREMSEKGDMAGCVAAIAAFALGFVIGSCAGRSASNQGYQTEAIERGYAEYNAKTGAWQWKGEK